MLRGLRLRCGLRHRMYALRQHTYLDIGGQRHRLHAQRQHVIQDTILGMDVHTPSA